MIEELQVLNPVTNSDYCVIQWQVRVNAKAQVEARNKINFHKGKYGKVRVELQEPDWE